MRFWLVDSFTDTPFAGNPAGVVLLNTPADDTWMQAVASEFKHSETAFVHGDRLRWFTPAREVDLCGHATLAAAHVLGGDHVFRTRSGPLTCRADNGWVHMDFPADPPEPSTVDVAQALPGVTVEFVGRGVSDVIVAVNDAAEARAVQPDLSIVSNWDARGLIITAPGDRPGIDMVSRTFYPAYGVPEDPVTGSAHCTLAPYWADRLGRPELVGEQASQRSGIVRMHLRGDRVGLAGQAVTVASGELAAEPAR
ncbi:PhzF family phenazine biosynthesis protein [Nocardia sp. NPDC049220]|uniref:PhzF family phenazine biosynthesis protein n=1 Tax=Nocardia sp. NPDC049220 TaxID=3155273 RepID=UPI0033F68383